MTVNANAQIYGLTMDWIALIDAWAAIGQLPDEDQEAEAARVRAEFEALEGETAAKLDRLAGMILAMEARADELAAEGDRLKARAKQIRGGAERIKQQMTHVFRAAGWDEVAAGKRPGWGMMRYSLRYVAPSKAVELTGEPLPLQYLRSLDPVPDKRKIGEALKRGETVPGAYLRTGEPSVAIRKGGTAADEVEE